MPQDHARAAGAAPLRVVAWEYTVDDLTRRLGSRISSTGGDRESRTLQTALTALDWLIIEGVKVEADADWQEVYDKPCDTGSPLSEISGDFPRFDFSKVDPVYPNKSSINSNFLNLPPILYSSSPFLPSLAHKTVAIRSLSPNWPSS